MEPDSQVAEQHNARRHPGRYHHHLRQRQAHIGRPVSRVTLILDTENTGAELVREYLYPGGLFAENQANMQVLPNGNVFIGWGSEPFFSEFSRDGRLLYNANLPPETESHKAFRFPWEGRPPEDPAVKAESGRRRNDALRELERRHRSR